MKTLYKSNKCNLYLALVHHPVINKNSEIIVSAVTNLDLHDIARASITYGVKSVYIITPCNDQIKLINKIIGHWTNGVGSTQNPKRRQALELIRVKPTYNDVLKEIQNKEACMPVTIATTARSGFTRKRYKDLRNDLSRSIKPYMLVFGTAWGLTDKFLCNTDFILGSIEGPGKYNHLSVRSAVSIVLDRLLGR